MSAFFYPDADKRNPFIHMIMAMPAYLFWCFRCLTGWTSFDQVDGFDRYFKKLQFIAEAGYPTEKKFGEYEYESIRFGILDFLFIVPAAVKILMRVIQFFNTYGPHEMEYLAIPSIVLIVLWVPLTIFNYIIAFAIVTALSPLLVGYRLYATSKWTAALEAVETLELYAPPVQNKADLLGQYDACPESLCKLTVADLLTTYPLEHLEFFPTYTDKQIALHVFSHDWKVQGIVIPHKGNKDNILAIVHLGLLTRHTAGEEILAALKHQLTQMEPKSQKTFTTVFTLRQAFLNATEDASDGLKQFANSNIPALLFNDEIAGFAGLPTLKPEELKANDKLHDHFVKKGRMFQEEASIKLAHQPPEHASYNNP